MIFLKILEEKLLKSPNKELKSFFGSKCSYRTVKLFCNFMLKQSNSMVSNQSATSPPGINPFVTLFSYFITDISRYRTWLAQSKPLVNQLVEKLHENSSPQRQLVRALLPPVESRNRIVTGLVQSLFVRSVVTRNPPSC